MRNAVNVSVVPSTINRPTMTSNVMFCRYIDHMQNMAVIKPAVGNVLNRIIPFSVSIHLLNQFRFFVFMVFSPSSRFEFARSLDVFDQENILLLTKVGK